jgi:hypothetical protein
MVGRLSRIRVSSVTDPVALNGTLKSTRMKTRFPAMSNSLIVLMAMSGCSVPPIAGACGTKKSAPESGARRMLQGIGKS